MSPIARNCPRRVSPLGVLICLAVLAPPTAMVLVIHRYAVNVPYWDEWDMLPVVPQAFDGTLDWASIWAQQLEHRSVTAKLVSLLLAKTTQLNLVDEMYLGFAFDFLSLLLIWNMLQAGLKGTSEALIGPLTIVASLLLFWPVTFEIWTWGIASFQYFSASFWAVLTVWALTRHPGRWKGVVIACISTAIAIYTTGHGFALVPVGTLGILAAALMDRRIRWPQISLFVLFGLGCVVVYLRNYIPPTHHPEAELSHVTPFHLVRYFLTYMGAPFWTTEARLSRYFGLLGISVILASLIYIVRSMRDEIRSAMPWLLLASYALVNASITALARIRYGVYQAASSRYSAIVILFWISIIVLSSMIAIRLRARFNRAALRLALTALFMIFTGGYSYLYYNGLYYLRLRNAIFVQGLPYVLDYDRAPDDRLQVFHFLPSTVRKLSRKLEQYQLGPFAGRPRSAPTPAE